MELIKVKDKFKWFTDDMSLVMHMVNWELCIDKVDGFSISELVEYAKTKIESGFIGSGDLVEFSQWDITTTSDDDKSVTATIALSQYANQSNVDNTNASYKMGITIRIVFPKQGLPLVSIDGTLYMPYVDEILKYTLPSGSNYILRNPNGSAVKENPFLNPATIIIRASSKKGALGIIYDGEVADISGGGILKKVLIPENLSLEDGIAFVNATLSKMVVYPTSPTVTSELDTYEANKSMTDMVSALIEFLTTETTFCITAAGVSDMRLSVSLEYI